MTTEDSVSKYTMMLFSRYEDPHSSLAEIYDVVRTKNPVAANEFSYPDLMELYNQWKIHNRNRPIKVKMTDKVAQNANVIGVVESNSAVKNLGANTVVVDTDPQASQDDTTDSKLNPQNSAASAEGSTPVVASSSTASVTSAAVAVAASQHIIDYMVVSEFNIGQFTVNVKELMAQGWVPIGGVTRSASGGGGPGYYLQAMVKYGDQSLAHMLEEQAIAEAAANGDESADGALDGESA